MDIVGPLPRTRKGNRYILTVQCSFTKRVEAYPISNQRATTCARVFIKNWVYRYGVPDSIHSDQGMNFQSKVFKQMYELLQMKPTRTIAYHPQCNGQIEKLPQNPQEPTKDEDRWISWPMGWTCGLIAHAVVSILQRGTPHSSSCLGGRFEYASI